MSSDEEDNSECEDEEGTFRRYVGQIRTVGETLLVWFKVAAELARVFF